jgi:hypothetical protein
MILRKFRETGPDVIFLIAIVLVATWTGAFLHPQMPSDLSFDVKPMPLFGLLLGICGSDPLITTIVAFFIMILISFLLVNFNTNVFFISERNYLPALTYTLLIAFLPHNQLLNPVLPAAVFLILSVRRIMASYKIQYTAFSFFDAGILISIGSLFYANFIWFGLLLVIGIAILRTGNLKEILLSLIGLITPVFIYTGFYYVTGKDMNSLLSSVNYNLFSKAMSYRIPAITLIAMIISGIIVLVCVGHLLSAINAKKIKSRKTFVLLFWTFFIAAGIGVLFKAVSIEIFYLAAVPVSYFLTHYFVFSRKRMIPEIMLVILFVLAAAVQIANLMAQSH